MESAGLASALLRSHGGTSTAAHTMARISNTTMVKLLDLPLRLADRNPTRHTHGGWVRHSSPASWGLRRRPATILLRQAPRFATRRQLKIRNVCNTRPRGSHELHAVAAA